MFLWKFIIQENIEKWLICLCDCKRYFEERITRECPYRSNPSQVFLGKGVVKICSKCTGEHPCRTVISTMLQSNFIEIAFWHRCSPVNLLHIFGTPIEGCFWREKLKNASKHINTENSNKVWYIFAKNDNKTINIVCNNTLFYE